MAWWSLWSLYRLDHYDISEIPAVVLNQHHVQILKTKQHITTIDLLQDPNRYVMAKVLIFIIFAQLDRGYTDDWS